LTGWPNATVVSAPTVFAIPKEEVPVESQSFVDEIPAKPEALKIESTGQPLAFGSLLEPPATETEDDTAAFVAPPSPELADRDWNAGEDEEEEDEEEDSASSSWRRDGGSDDFAPEPGAEKEAEKAGSRGKRREGWTPTREKSQDLLEEAVAAESIPSIPAPMPSVISEVAAPQNSWALPNLPGPQLVESKTIEEDFAPNKADVAPVIASFPETISHQPAAPNGANSWFSTTSSPWEAEAQKANQLAATWDAPAAPVASAPSESVPSEPFVEQPTAVEEPEPETPVSYDFVSEAPSEEPVHYVPDPGLVSNEVVAHNRLPELISDGSISAETVETIRQETTSALESVSQPVFEEPAKVSAKVAETSQQDMDTLVANVLAKMSPEMLQAVTREILKPVVAAMIRDEINAKKS
jgi:hypothetical protein